MIFMNWENSNTSEANRLKLDLAVKMDLRRGYKCGNIKPQCLLHIEDYKKVVQEQ